MKELEPKPGTLSDGVRMLICPRSRNLFKKNFFKLLSGEKKAFSILVVFCEDKKSPTGEFVVSPEEGVYGIHIPAGQWHTLVVREEGMGERRKGSMNCCLL